jgi:hypothetical protein
VHKCGKDIEMLPLETYDSILILADEDYESNQCHDMMQADTRSLTSLLLIRDIQQKRNVNTRVKGRLSIFDADFTRKSRLEASRTKELKSPVSDLLEEALHRSPSGRLVEEEDESGGSEGSDEEGHGQGHGQGHGHGRGGKKKALGAAVISEILDVRTKPLISVASVTDYVTSNELVC